MEKHRSLPLQNKIRSSNTSWIIGNLNPTSIPTAVHYHQPSTTPFTSTSLFRTWSFNNINFNRLLNSLVQLPKKNESVHQSQSEVDLWRWSNLQVSTQVSIQLVFSDPSGSTVIPICAMVLVYLPTWLGDFVRANVGKDSRHGTYGIQLRLF